MRKLLLASVLLIACTSRVDVGATGARGEVTPDAGELPEAGTPDAARAAVTVPAATTQLAAGGQSTCAITVARGVVCWGSNASGELGHGAFEPTRSAAPLPVKGLTNVRAVSGGVRAHCAVLDDGTARCWGASLFGIIAGPNTFEISAMSSPHAHTGLGADVARVAFGLRFACALTTTGRVKCWGTGGSGQLGNGSTGDEIVARDVADTAGEPFVDLAVSGSGLFACAVAAGGDVYCWGDNGAGQLGVAPSAPGAVPSRVTDLPERAIAAAAGRAHACAILASGGVACWGADAAAQLGSGRASAGFRPRVVPGIESARSIVAGGAHTCVIDAAGEVVCWGANDGGSIAPTPGPKAATRVTESSFGAVAVAAGIAHTCVLGADRSVSCRGAADTLQTGTGDFAL